MQPREKFYSKILLFGEYALIVGSQALSIPYRELHGAFSAAAADHPSAFDSNAHLKKYAAYLQQQETLRGWLDVDRFENDIASGLVFESNIPLGYGLGSSGALVAAVYERYRLENHDEKPVSGERLQQLKNRFALMESWFHGKSSGLDPLICYLQQAVKVGADGQLQTVEIPQPESASGTLFLLDTGTTGETQPLVNYFMQQCEKPGFLHQIRSELVPLNEKCIAAYLAGHARELFSCVEQLSAFTLQHFRPMIPERLLPYWQKGLENKSYSLKLCGSGGGGMMLGFTRHFEETKKQLEPFPLKTVQQL